MDEMTIERLEGGAQGKVGLKVSGSVTIAQAAELRVALLEALQEADELQVDLSGATGVDLTALQLLCAAHQSCEQAGKRFGVIDGEGGVFRLVAADAGFVRHVGCTRDNTGSCIWVGGDN
jgi:anti-anti-sigma regulatory factor